jgi:putative protease
MAELLAPAGTFDKMVAAFNYGADAVYFAGKRFGLRAFAGNFDDEEIEKAVEYAHARGKKVYITINIIAHDSDFEGLEEYLHFLEKAGVDAVIVADVGVAVFVKQHSNLTLHISTQANILNTHSALFFASLGAKRLILARELSLAEVKKIRQALPKEIELEVFVHGAMCISYSGRCLLSNYLTGRDSNRGLCSQPCRWEYTITEKTRQGEQYTIEEDNHGTYIFNSKDMNLLPHLDKLILAGIDSFKIEGRMKSEYYVANITNAYRRAIDQCLKDPQNWQPSQQLLDEVYKSSHREYTSGFMFGDTKKENQKTSLPIQSHKFVAIVLQDWQDGKVLVEHRNRFAIGDELEVLSFGENWNKKFVVEHMTNQEGEFLPDAKFVNQHIILHTDIPLKKGEMLRIKDKQYTGENS